MLTKNAYALMFGLMNNSTSVPMKPITGTEMKIQLNSTNYADVDDRAVFRLFSSPGFSSNKPALSGVYFGTGDTAPNVNDYTLSKGFITNLTYGETYVSFNSEDSYVELQATISVENKGTSTVTIKELGLFGQMRSVTNTYVMVLMDRIVLDTPVTISAGGAKSITYNLRFTFPTA